VVSQPLIAILLLACPLLPFLLMIFFKGDRLPARSRGAAWVCGYDHEKSMVITAHGFAMPVKEAFAPLLKLRHWLNPVRLVPGWQSASAPALFRGVAWLSWRRWWLLSFREEPENERFNCTIAGAAAVCRRALLSGITRVARARLHNRRGPGCCRSIGISSSCWVARASGRMFPAGFSA
jgi:hypothetical protein